MELPGGPWTDWAILVTVFSTTIIMIILIIVVTRKPVRALRHRRLQCYYECVGAQLDAYTTQFPRDLE